jgi:hypothetical protein
MSFPRTNVMFYESKIKGDGTASHLSRCLHMGFRSTATDELSAVGRVISCFGWVVLCTPGRELRLSAMGSDLRIGARS